MAEKLSEDTKTIIVAILLVLFWPIGWILMLIWERNKWPVWVQLLASSPGCLVVIALVGALVVGFMSVANPSGAVKSAQCQTTCESSVNKDMCVAACIRGELTPTP